MSKDLIKTSKFLSFILRHEPESIGLALDKQGWADIDLLIEGARKSGTHLTFDVIKQVVATNDKKRFQLSDDGTRIRAVQGHSTEDVARDYEPLTPPPLLYHGTADRFLASIRQQGLIPGQRHHVHLSQDAQTATKVGARHGRPVILEVAAGEMHAQGLAFFQAENGVWLTAHVPVAFLKFP